jgi:hypothetical protein
MPIDLSIGKENHRATPRNQELTEVLVSRCSSDTCEEVVVISHPSNALAHDDAIWLAEIPAKCFAAG